MSRPVSRPASCPARSSRRRSSRCRSACASAVGALLCLVLAAAPADGAAEPAPSAPGGPLAYELPVDGPVVAVFDAPLLPFGPGHRGVDIAVEVGAEVEAAAAGRVTFAGAVAGERWVTVEHPGGVLTSYGPLASVLVDVGRSVTATTPIGTATGQVHAPVVGALHWSARVAGEYVDPLSFVTQRWRPALVGPGGWQATDVPEVPRYAPLEPGLWGMFAKASPEATGPGFHVPPNPNHVVLLAGFGSRTGEAPIDPTHLGYRPDDVSQFSYARISELDGPAAVGRGASPYGPAHTWAGVERAALALRDQLRRRWRAEPGQAVDLVGHSLGGVVAMYYLTHLHDPADPTLPPIGNVVAVASPLQGTDLVNALRRVEDHELGGPLVGAGKWATDRFLPGLGTRRYDLGSRTVDDLAVGSPVTRSLATRWQEALAEGPAGALATGTRVLNLTGEDDLLVPAHRASLPGAEQRVLMGHHEGVARTQAALSAIHDFLAGEPLPASPAWAGRALTWLYSQGLLTAGSFYLTEVRGMKKMFEEADRISRTPGWPR